MNTPPTTLKAVALGGGHGLHATLSALRLLTDDVTAVVTVADDGGSSGRLRRELGLLPPGDLRMAVSALAADDELGRRWRTLVQHRFGGIGALAGHAVGNLLIAGLIDTLGDPVAALDALGGLLGVRGRVLPMCTEPLDIGADVTGLGADPERAHRIRGQVAVASTPGRVQRVWLVPDQPRACPDALAAVLAADVVVLGPGSWFTSVLPHLLVPGLAEAIVASPARRLVTLNLATDNETLGLSVADHLAALSWYLPGLRVDTVLADAKWVGEPEPVHRAAESLGARLVLAPLAVADGSPRHDPESLGVALVPVLGAAR